MPWKNSLKCVPGGCAETRAFERGGVRRARLAGMSPLSNDVRSARPKGVDSWMTTP
jgi:hypothetical protein